MLTMTSHAASLIRALVDSADLPPGAGLRLAQRDDHTALAMTLEASPRTVDVVVDRRDALLFLGPVAAQRTEHQVLDASTSRSSSAFFLLEQV